ncbi:benenodin family lasso peptide [Sphingobium phenoxybenzoativorans]|uniref:Benenodin family lasso peptide n=1 Tax=Sphingobium phenoxybenzoativorans TaxID=1592790 RepID=A0A975K6T7_9SPHN|nr:benenodin family lasso peptide [Sphingobium phenoxybenzoativorans]QUT05148.1 benenodin family lasso peptide [Sphingobium phenoxybenzoativorans]
MERDIDHEKALIDLGAASIETKGINGTGDEVLGQKRMGLSED